MDVSSVQQNCETEQLSIGKTASLANHATVEELVNKKGAEIAGKNCETVELKSKNSKAGERSMKEHASIEEYTIRRRSCNDVTHLIVASLDATPNSSSENIRKKLNAVSLEFPPEKTSVEEMQVLIENGINQSHLGNVAKKSRGGSKKNTGKSTKSKHAPRSVDIGRVLRSRSQEKGKDPEPSKISQEHGAGASGENRRKKKKKQMKNVADDEFSRTRRQIRYLLHRMAYEQNFIDAYAGEGWRGQSAEKLRPEKELQRAKSEIFRWKLKIRDLFQRIDLSIAEGRLPQSLFDSEGEIDSEDIFCSKCGLQDVTLENDIILCDGTCDRAFHQYCVQPALLKEDIPSGDEGWLCPGCDCKDDCLDLLNEAQGTTLSILDSWEKVYPEAAAGKTLDSNLELPSDDSEDNDYNPDDPEEEEEEKEVAPANEQNLQLPSDDSQDDDFDPDAADMDEEVKQESSDSDFSSASEDLNLIVDTNGSPYETSAKANEIMSGKVKVGRGKRSSLNDELASLLEIDTNQGEFSLIAPRREVERLDYKKLFDEQYGHVSTDSSDEEYFDAADSPKRQRENNADSEKTPQKRARKKLISGGTSDSLLKLNKVPSEASSCSASAKMLGEAATQLPSDDSKDEDFDADATDVDEEVKQESSDSDFSSASEDLNLVVDANGSPHENSAMVNDFMPGQVKSGRDKRPSLNDELSSLVETDTSQGEPSPIAPRREVERLDYKKLYDEQYGNLSTDSSDEEFTDAADAPKRQRKNNADSEKTPKRRAHKKLNTEGTSDSPLKSKKVPSKPGSRSARAKTLGEATTQGLLIAFKENQNPERAAREKLASELAITVQQVTKWFGNARWSYRHTPSFASKLADIPSKGTSDQINQAEDKGADQSGEPSDVKTHIFNTTYSHQKAGKRDKPKDDSQDDDFDPDAADVDDEVKQESSDSDFSSASEDLHLIANTNGSPHENSAMANELISGQNKEQYGIVSIDAPKRRRKSNENSEKTPKNKARKKLITGTTSSLPSKSNNIPSETGSRSASAKTLGAGTQGLLISFKKNQNPDRATRQKLAAEFGITVQQVTKWFGNARWSYRHTPSFASKLADIPSKGTSAQINQIEDIQHNSAEDVEGADQSEEPRDVKAHIPMDNTKNTTNSHQKVGNRGKTKGKKSAKSSAKSKNTPKNQ